MWESQVTGCQLKTRVEVKAQPMESPLSPFWTCSLPTT